MNKISRYKEKWQNSEFNQLFIGFKQFILPFEEECAHQSAELIAPQLPSRDIQLLDLGAGDGNVSLFFLEKLSEYKRLTHYTAIDISQELALILQSKEEIFKQYTQEVSCDCADILNFTPSIRPHLIIAFNSWFGVPFEEIRRYLALLEPGGILAIMLASKDSITIDLTAQFVEPIQSVEELLNWLIDEKFAFARYPLASRRIERSNFFQDSTINPAGEIFFRYLLRRTNSTLDDIIPYLKQKPELYFRMPKDLILLKKPG